MRSTSVGLLGGRLDSQLLVKWLDVWIFNPLDLVRDALYAQAISMDQRFCYKIVSGN